MKLDARLNPYPATVRRQAQRLEAAGYGRAGSSEDRHDPFMPLGLAADGTSSIELGTHIAVAFARNPMTVAHASWDLQLLSAGRFVLGLGAQVKGHITQRFSMPWSEPAARMDEFVAAMHAIWDAWEGGARLDFRGDFYQHTFTREMFVPPIHSFGRPRVHLAAVGPLMTKVAGRVADGLLCHSFTTADYLREITLPTLRAALDGAGRAPGSVEVCQLAMVVAANDAESYDIQARDIREQIAIIGSTWAYRGVLAQHGWEGAQDELQALFRQGRLADMIDLIDDEMLHTFAAVGTPIEVADILLARFGGHVDRITLMPAKRLPGQRSERSVLFPADWDPLVERLRNPPPPRRHGQSAVYERPSPDAHDIE